MTMTANQLTRQQATSNTSTGSSVNLKTLLFPRKNRSALYHFARSPHMDQGTKVSLKANAVYESYVAFVQILYTKMLEHQTELKNTFVSPLSLYLTMAMTSLGCTGQTKKDLVKALNLPPHRNEYEVHSANGALFTRGLKSSNYLHVRSAHRLFVLHHADVGTKYVKDAYKYYNTNLEDLSSMKDNDTKRRYMNDWVCKVTDYHVQDLLPLSSISEETVFTMVDALYVKGIFRERFPKECTTTAPFYRISGPAMTVNMMSTKGLYRVHTLSDCQARVIKLPLGNTDWEYVIVLPDNVNGLRNVLSYLASGNHLHEMLTAQYKLASVTLQLPRFKVSNEPSMNIKRLLCSMGASALFQKNGSDMNGICRKPSGCLSDIFHRVVIEVDEEGADDALPASLPPSSPFKFPSVNFCVDHPFLLAVVFNGRIPVFMGHVLSPNSR